jgi:type IV secretion system protein VirD4
MRERSTEPACGPTIAIFLVFAATSGFLWAGGAIAAVFSGHAIPRRHVLAGWQAFAHPGDPSDAWQVDVGPAPVYWCVTIGLLILVGCAMIALVHRLVGLSWSQASGFASAGEMRKVAGRRALDARAGALRPNRRRPTTADLGIQIGRSTGVACYASVEDSVVVVGPPRSGKGLHLVIPTILDAPGAVVTTSTRPDNLAATIEPRRRLGPIAVFDPQGLAMGIKGALRWSPSSGCAVPGIAMSRAHALTAERGRGVDNASFWAQQCETAVRCLLHAAELDGRDPIDLLRWSLSPLAAEEAVEILRYSERATPAWDTALDAILSADPRQRDSTWSMVANAFACLADPLVLDAVTPRDGERFDQREFLRSGGTLYLLGTATGASATSGLVTAMLEDFTETARKLAARSAGARLDPPLTVVLDEAANYPLPSLLPLMSEGGGSGISTWVVVQSMAQARARWGVHEAEAMWDASVVKVALGGSSNADDLRDMASLLGNRQVSRSTTSVGADGRRTRSTSDADVAMLEPAELRTLPFGQGLLLLRSCRPARLQLRPWTRRRDAQLVKDSQAEVERLLAADAAGIA